MKTKQTKINRSAAKLLPGAMALAATTASSQAAVVQITFTGNKISTTGGNTLYADLTGDGVGDVVFGATRNSAGRVGVVINGSSVYAGFGSVGGTWMVIAIAYFADGAVGPGFAYGQFPTVSATALNGITFSDSRVNGGAITEGWVEVMSAVEGSLLYHVELARLIFDDSSTTRPAFTEIPGTQSEWAAVPEPSSLGILALGAGGLLARRRRAKQAA